MANISSVSYQYLDFSLQSEVCLLGNSNFDGVFCCSEYVERSDFEAIGSRIPKYGQTQSDYALAHHTTDFYCLHHFDRTIQPSALSSSEASMDFYQAHPFLFGDLMTNQNFISFSEAMHLFFQSWFVVQCCFLFLVSIVLFVQKSYLSFLALNFEILKCCHLAFPEFIQFGPLGQN